MSRYRIVVRNSEPYYFAAWECEAESISALLAAGAVRENIGPDQPYDELIVSEIR